MQYPSDGRVVIRDGSSTMSAIAMVIRMMSRMVAQRDEQSCYPIKEMMPHYVRSVTSLDELAHPDKEMMPHSVRSVTSLSIARSARLLCHGGGGVEDALRPDTGAADGHPGGHHGII